MRTCGLPTAGVAALAMFNEPINVNEESNRAVNSNFFIKIPLCSCEVTLAFSNSNASGYCEPALAGSSKKLNANRNSLVD
jgi:hypothetical protein